MEFVKEEDKIRVLEGGPWRHKGNALIVMHYDSLVRPSKISNPTDRSMDSLL
jgi:hypothetical protein